MLVILLQRPDVVVHHASWTDLLGSLERPVDTLIVDAPYSERTHGGHNDGASIADNAALGPSKPNRTKIPYASWTDADVDAFVQAWAPSTRGWMVSLTDTMLAPVWDAAMRRAGRYTFSPLACVEPGSRVRMAGDGPAQWSVWAIVSRPRTSAAAKWRSLPGAYVVPSGHNARSEGGKLVTGGKPLWLMESLVEDYSNPGDVVCDPCCGAGTTLLAALRRGRKAIGGDQLEAHARMAAAAADAPVQTPMWGAL